MGSIKTAVLSGEIIGLIFPGRTKPPKAHEGKVLVDWAIEKIGGQKRGIRTQKIFIAEIFTILEIIFNKFKNLHFLLWQIRPN